MNISESRGNVGACGSAMLEAEAMRAARAAISGRVCVLAAGPVANPKPWVDLLMACGAKRVLYLDAGLVDYARAVGYLEGVERFDMRLRGSTPAGIVRAFQERIWQWPGELQRCVDTCVRDGMAPILVLASIFQRPTAGHCALDIIGGRSADDAMLEDKIAAEPIWENIGVMGRRIIVPARREELNAAINELWSSSGVVLARDSVRAGLSAGCDGTRIVKHRGLIKKTVDWAITNADRVRVMPFYSGTPCSIHALCLDDGTEVFAPFEQFVLQRPGGTQPIYAGLVQHAFASMAARERMRTIAMRVADRARAMVGYRGMLSVDGVLVADDFIPTEINSRFSDGCWVLSQEPAWGHLPILDLLARHSRFEMRLQDLPPVPHFAECESRSRLWCYAIAENKSHFDAEARPTPSLNLAPSPLSAERSAVGDVVRWNIGANEPPPSQARVAVTFGGATNGGRRLFKRGLVTLGSC